MSSKLLPIDDVIERTGLSRRTLYQEISNNRFPRAVQLTARRVGWPEADVEKWISDKIAARDGVAA
ncbi:helix-turn-helix transcriptional regulator [Rhizobium leguminosarum]